MLRGLWLSEPSDSRVSGALHDTLLVVRIAVDHYRMCLGEFNATRCVKCFTGSLHPLASARFDLLRGMEGIAHTESEQTERARLPGSVIM